jgi:hypothetical protein
MEDEREQPQTPPEDPLAGEGFGLGGSGWDATASRGEPAGRMRGRPIESQCVDFCPICRTADVLRATVPLEFQEHWHAWQREMLLAARSLLDHYIEHVESARRRAVQVEDIPID